MNLLEWLLGKQEDKEVSSELLEEPQMTNPNISIQWIHKRSRTIYLWSKPQIAQKLEKYGQLYKYIDCDKYSLEVDARYSLDKVEEYIRSLREINNELSKD